MKARLVFWIIAGPLWCVSGAVMMICLIFSVDAPNVAATNQQQKTALIKRGQLVEDYLKNNGRLPSTEEFEKVSSNVGDDSMYEYDLHTSRPGVEDGFKFPEWPDGKLSFAIGYWSGEWFEFYDSNSRSTTLDETSTVSFWRENAFRPLGWAAAFGIPPFVLLWLLRKKTPDK